MLLLGALVQGWASIGFARRRKALGMWLLGAFITLGGMRLAGPRSAICLGCWRNGSKRPVLKHGPRSLTSMRVFGCQARSRNESERRREPLGAPSTGPGVYRRI